MKITFLGTGTSQGVPMIGCGCEVCRSIDTRDKRLRSSVLVESNTTKIVIDAGPDFRTQMLREDVCTLDAILLTHEHYDHVAGIDDVRAFNYWDKRPTPVYATSHTQNALCRMLPYAFEQMPYPGAPDITLHTIETGKEFRIGDIDILPIEGLHYKLPVMGFRFGSFAYLTDMNSLPKESIELLYGCKTLVINALRWTEHLSHFTVDQAIAISRQVGAQTTYLTHTSHQLGLHAKVEPALPSDIWLAYDGLIIEAGS